MASSFSRNCASDREFEEYLTEIRSYQKNIKQFHTKEQNNIRHWFGRLALHTDAPSQKIIRKEYAQHLSHLLKHGRIEYPFTKAPPPFDRDLKPLYDVVYKNSRSNRCKKNYAGNFEHGCSQNRRETMLSPTRLSTVTASCGSDSFPDSVRSFSRQHKQTSELRRKDLELCKFDTRNFDDEEGTNLSFQQQENCESCEGRQYLHEEIQHIKLSPRQKRKLDVIQEERKHFLEDSNSLTENLASVQANLDMLRLSETPTSRYPKRTNEPLSVRCFLEDPQKMNVNCNHFEKSSFHPSQTSPSCLLNKQRGGTTDSFSRSDSQEFKIKSKLNRGPRFINTTAEGGTTVDESKEEVSWIDSKDEKSGRSFLSENQRVKTCISCGRLIKEEFGCKAPPKLPPYQTDLFKTVWEKESDLSLVEQGKNLSLSQDCRHSRIPCDVKDDIQLILSNLDPDISLREFVLLFSPMLEDKGELMKNVTGEEIYKFLKGIESIYTLKFEHAYRLFCSTHQSIKKNYSEYEEKLSHQKNIFESEIRSVLPNFNWEEYLRSEDYLPKALEAANLKLPSTESGFQEARKRQHAALQCTKREVEKIRVENLTLRKQLESLTKNCSQTQQIQIRNLVFLLDKFKTLLHTAVEFHRKLESNTKPILELLERKEECFERRK